jgi:hypothetical protein
MNIKLDWHSDFLGICAYEDKIYPNHFHVDLHLITKSEDAHYQNIAFERMKVIVNELFAHGIFVGHDNPNLEKLSQIYPEKMVLLPEEAYDQVIGLALFCKLNAVMEDVMSCIKIRISSKFGEDVWYEFEDGDEMGPFSKDVKLKGRRKNKTPWWRRNDLMTFDATGNLSVTTWEDLDLGWEPEVHDDHEPEIEVELRPERSADVIDMRKSKKIKKSKFNAEVVNGGKTTDDD